MLGRCAQEQISLSLPSLRVGSIDDEIMQRMSDLRRTGCTLAPEAGSQRLRDVINKGVTEEQVLLHVQKLLEYGWRQVKLYFMIGLPTETDEDLKAIADLCRKVRDAAEIHYLLHAARPAPAGHGGALALRAQALHAFPVGGTDQPGRDPAPCAGGAQRIQGPEVPQAALARTRHEPSGRHPFPR